MILYSKEDIGTFNFPKNEYGEYLETILNKNVEDLLLNAKGKTYILVLDDNTFIPIFVAEKSKNSTYLVSLYSHYILYAKEELRELNNKMLEFIGNCFLDLIGLFIKPCKIDDVVYINQQLVSSNLYPDINFDFTVIDEINNFLAKKFPKKIICWNSINEITTSKLYQEMKKTNMLFLPSRSIYVYKKFQDKLSKDTKRDMNLMKKTPLVLKKLDDTNFDALQIQKLYTYLYIDKYSKFNQIYTQEYIKQTYLNKFIKYHGLFDNDEIVGVVGSMVIDNTTATPIVGFDTSRDLKDGIYRILMLTAYQEARDNNRIYHCSAGASSFKRNRQAQNVFEFRVIHFSKTTTFLQRNTLKTIAYFFEKIVRPMMEKRGL